MKLPIKTILTKKRSSQRCCKAIKSAEESRLCTRWNLEGETCFQVQGPSIDGPTKTLDVLEMFIVARILQHMRSYFIERKGYLLFWNPKKKDAPEHEPCLVYCRSRSVLPPRCMQHRPRRYLRHESEVLQAHSTVLRGDNPDHQETVFLTQPRRARFPTWSAFNMGKTITNNVYNNDLSQVLKKVEKIIVEI